MLRCHMILNIGRGLTSGERTEISGRQIGAFNCRLGKIPATAESNKGKDIWSDSTMIVRLQFLIQKARAPYEEADF